VRPALFLRPDAQGLRCSLCPHACTITEGRTGVCGVRRLSKEAATLPFYGRVSSLALDPIEKKPLYHFLPGARILSAGFLGCNLHCPFCQNFAISQDLEADSGFIPPEELAGRAGAGGSIGLAYTYSEPLIHVEYVLDAAEAVRRAGLRNVIVTNGHVTVEAARTILPLMDAANVDLKAFKAETYRRVLGGDLEAVKAFIALAAAQIHLEVTTLIVPGMNDDPEEIDALTSWLAGISRDIPYHISAYRPAWKYTAPPTSLISLSACMDAARRHLRFVYAGNVSALGQDTVCPVCGATLIRRRGYEIEIGELEGDRCTRCGARIPLVYK